MNESPAWLKMLAEASSQERALDSIRMADAVLAGTAPGGNIKDGGKLYREIRQGFVKQAGI